MFTPKAKITIQELNFHYQVIETEGNHEQGSVIDLLQDEENKKSIPLLDSPRSANQSKPP